MREILECLFLLLWFVFINKLGHEAIACSNLNGADRFFIYTCVIFASVTAGSKIIEVFNN